MHLLRIFDVTLPWLVGGNLLCSSHGDFPLPVMACGVVGAASWAICVLASIHLPSGPCWLLSLLCLACLGVWHPLYSVVLACRLAFGAPFGPKATVGHVVRLTNMEEILAARDLRGFLDNRQQEPQSISVLRRRDGSRPGIAHIRFSNVTDAAKVARLMEEAQAARAEADRLKGEAEAH